MSPTAPPASPGPPSGPIFEPAYDASLSQIISDPALRALFDSEGQAAIDWAITHDGSGAEIQQVPGTKIWCLKFDGTPRFPMLRVYYAPSTDGSAPRLLDVDEIDFYGDEEDATS